MTKVCETDYQVKNPKVYNHFTLPTPEGMVEDGIVEIDPTFADLFKATMKEKKIKAKQAVFSISSSKIASREVSIPMVKENRIGILVKANAAEYFPIDLSQYQISYSMLGVEADGKGNQQYKLQVLAAPNSLLIGYKEFTTALGLELLALDYGGNSLYHAIKEECAEGTQAIVKIDERSSLIMIVKDSAIVLNRSIAYGIDDAIHAVRKHTVLGETNSYEEALKLCEKTVCISAPKQRKESESGAPKQETADAVGAAKEEVANTFKYLVGGIERVIDYYNSRSAKDPLTHILLTGLGSKFLGLEELLSRELNIKTEVLTQLEGFQLDKSFGEEHFGEYITCIGATVEPVDFISALFETKQKGLLKKKEKNQEKSGETGKAARDYDMICRITLIGGLGIALVLILASLIPYLMANNTNKSLTEKIQQYQPAVPIYEAYLNEKAAYNKVKELDETAANRLEEVNTFLGEMEQRMPTSFAVHTFTADTAGVTLDVSVENKAAAAKVISEFRSFEMVSGADVTAVMEQESEIGETQVTFSIVITFKPMESETAQEQTAQVQTTQEQGQ